MMKFRMAGIKVPQYAFLADSLSEGEIGFSVGMYFRYSVEGRRVACGVKCEFKSKEEKLLVSEVFCEFEIATDDWNNAISGNMVTIPKGMLEIFGTQTIGVVRGILYSKSEGGPGTGLILPPINVTELVNSDLTFELN